MIDYFLLTELANIRKEKRISRETLAKDLDVAVSTIEKWELCKNGPRFEQLIDWANRLGYELDLHPKRG